MSSRSKKKQLQKSKVNNQFKQTNEVPKIVIGIISYLPDNWDLKVVRVKRLNALFQQCDRLLNLPIMIIAQNWGGIEIKEGTIRESITIYQYPKLGINGARNKLREKFLESDYDYLIMLDDDSQLTGNVEDSTEYIRQIQLHPDMYCEYKPMLMKLFAISKYMYNLIDIPEGGADDPDPSKRFFEDMMIIKALQKHYPERGFRIPYKTFMEVSDAAWDKYSTGWHELAYDSEGKWTRHHTGDQTRSLVRCCTKGKDGKIIWNKPDYIKWNTNWNNYLD